MRSNTETGGKKQKVSTSRLLYCYNVKCLCTEAPKANKKKKTCEMFPSFI